MTVANPTDAREARERLNAKARRSILRIVGEGNAAAALEDGELEGYLASLRLEADTAGELHATLRPCLDGRRAAVLAEEAFPSAGHPDFAFTFAEEE